MADDTDINWKARSAVWLHWMEDNPRIVLLTISHLAAFTLGAVFF